MMRTLIIGAGIAGLATAALLAREGQDVTVLEQRTVIGGRAGSTSEGGFRFDTGPSWYLMPRAYENFYGLLGHEVENRLDLVDLDPGYAVFSEPLSAETTAQRVDVPAGEPAVRRLFESLEPGAGAALKTYLESARRAHDLAEQYFLYNTYAHPTNLAKRDLLRAVPALTGQLATTLSRHVETRFKHPILRQILGYPAVFLGTRPTAAPALYHLMSALDLDEPVRYPRGGFYSIVSDLHDLALEAGARIETGARVRAIGTRAWPAKGRPCSHPLRRLRNRPALPGLPSRYRASVTHLDYIDATGAERTLPADTIVSAADLHHTETALLPPDLQTYPESWWDRCQSGPGALLLLLGVRGELPQLPHHSLFFTRDWDANFSAIFDSPRRVPEPPSIYVCKPSATDADVAPPGCENLFVLVPLPAQTELGHGDAYTGTPASARLETLGDAVIQQIAHWSGIPDLASRIVVRRSIGPADFADQYNSWQGGMLGPSHTLRQSAFLRAGNASQRVQGLYYAGSSVAPGVGVPMCLISAELVLKHMQRDSSPGPLYPQYVQRALDRFVGGAA
ncbi:phytoene desaturase [Micrococcales bacterium 31B]|nr:phytoene desaturase [Micrococcales bacterium 31B]